MTDFTFTKTTETPYLYVERSSGMNPEEVGNAMGKAFADVWGFMSETGIKPAGPALSVYYTYDPEKLDFRAGFIVSESDLPRASGQVFGDVTPACEVLSHTHVGSYAGLRAAYGEMMEFLEREGRQVGAPTWEVYLNDPAETPEDALRTDVFMSLAQAA